MHVISSQFGLQCKLSLGIVLSHQMCAQEVEEVGHRDTTSCHQYHSECRQHQEMSSRKTTGWKIPKVKSTDTIFSFLSFSSKECSDQVEKINDGFWWNNLFALISIQFTRFPIDMKINCTVSPLEIVYRKTHLPFFFCDQNGTAIVKIDACGRTLFSITFFFFYPRVIQGWSPSFEGTSPDQHILIILNSTWEFPGKWKEKNQFSRSSWYSNA